MLVGILVVFTAGTVFYRLVEGWTWLESLYFTVVTLTTVGYGDLAPTTPASRVFTIVLILVGVGYILAFLNLLVKRSTDKRRDRIG